MTASGADDLLLAAAFPPASREAWTALVERVLKGASPDALGTRSVEGVPIAPLSPKADPAPQPWRPHGRWRVSQRVDHPEPESARALALADLEGGADSLTLVLAGAPSARGFGLDIATVDDLDRALSGVMLDLVHLRLEAGGRGGQAAALLVGLARRRGHDLASLDLDLGLDPIGAMAASGRRPAAWPTVAGRCAETLATLREQGFGGRAFLCDGRPYHEAGAGEAQELAAVLATGVAYLRALEAGGSSLDQARDALAFLLVADADEFLVVAKFRALRRLWARVEEACGLSPRSMRLHAETAWRMTTRRDPAVNLLRGTMAAFAAGIGGADGVTVLPFTAALGLPDGFARRMARNTQLILLEESHLWRVADPAGGSGGFEALTGELCIKAWEGFQEMEREGGIVASLEAGALQARIAAVRAARERAVALRETPITGTSEFAHLRETAAAVLFPSPLDDEGASGSSLVVARSELDETAASFADLVDRASAGTTQAESTASPASATVAIAPLPSIRAAAPFERLRDRADRVLAETGTRPRIFLAGLGRPSAFAARAAFARNLFEAGGFETFGNETAMGASELVEVGRAWLEAQAVKRVCLCAADDGYADEGMAAIAALRQARVAVIALAKDPAGLDPAFGPAGVTHFVFPGCDVLAILNGCSQESPDRDAEQAR